MGDSYTSTRAKWFEHSMLVRVTKPSPSWGDREHQRVASMGGFSWSYGELPMEDLAVVGHSGAGNGLRLLISPLTDGTMSYSVELRRECDAATRHRLRCFTYPYCEG